MASSTTGDAERAEPSGREKALLDQLTRLRVAALADIVDDILVDVGGGLTAAMKRVFLTNTQAMLFTPTMMVDLLSRMGMPTPVPMVIFISRSYCTRAARGKKRIPDITTTRQKYEDDRDGIDEKSSLETERQIGRFVDDVLMPIVEDNNAIVVCSTGTDDCSLAKYVGAAFQRLQRGRGTSEATMGPRLLLIVNTPRIISKFVKDLFSKEQTAETAEDRVNTVNESMTVRDKSMASRVLLPLSSQPALNSAGKSALETGGGDQSSITATAQRSAGTFEDVSTNSFIHYEYLRKLLIPNRDLTNGSLTRLSTACTAADKQALREANYRHTPDLLSGATDVIFLDCFDEGTNRYTDGAMRHIETTLLKAYSSGERQVPCTAIALGLSNLSHLCELRDRKVPLLLIDTRKRREAVVGGRLKEEGDTRYEARAHKKRSKVKRVKVSPRTEEDDEPPTFSAKQAAPPVPPSSLPPQLAGTDAVPPSPPSSPPMYPATRKSPVLPPHVAAAARASAPTTSAPTTLPPSLATLDDSHGREDESSTARAGSRGHVDLAAGALAPRRADEAPDAALQMATIETKRGKQHVKAHVLELFKEYDTDGDGRMDYKELLEALRKLGHDPHSGAAMNLIAKYDGNQESALDAHEFEKLIVDIEGRKLVDAGAAFSVSAELLHVYSQYGRELVGRYSWAGDFPQPKSQQQSRWFDDAMELGDSCNRAHFLAMAALGLLTKLPESMLPGASYGSVHDAYEASGGSVRVALGTAHGAASATSASASPAEPSVDEEVCSAMCVLDTRPDEQLKRFLRKTCAMRGDLMEELLEIFSDLKPTRALATICTVRELLKKRPIAMDSQGGLKNTGVFEELEKEVRRAMHVVMRDISLLQKAKAMELEAREGWQRGWVDAHNVGQLATLDQCLRSNTAEIIDREESELIGAAIRWAILVLPEFGSTDDEIFKRKASKKKMPMYLNADSLNRRSIADSINYLQQKAVESGQPTEQEHRYSSSDVSHELQRGFDFMLKFLHDIYSAGLLVEHRIAYFPEWSSEPWSRDNVVRRLEQELAKEKEALLHAAFVGDEWVRVERPLLHAEQAEWSKHELHETLLADALACKQLKFSQAQFEALRLTSELTKDSWVAAKRSDRVCVCVTEHTGGSPSELSIREHERLALLEDEEALRVRSHVRVRSLETDVEGMVPVTCIDRQTPKAEADEKEDEQAFYKPLRAGAVSLEMQKERNNRVLVYRFALETVRLMHELDAQLGAAPRPSASAEALLAMFRAQHAAARVKFLVPREKGRLRGKEAVFGLEWRAVGSHVPPAGHQVLSNDALTAALRDKRQFSLAELEGMSGLDVHALNGKCCAMVDGACYQPCELRLQPSSEECEKCLRMRTEWFNDAYLSANLALYDAFISGHPSTIAAAWTYREMVVEAFKTPVDILARMSFRTLASMSRMAFHWHFADSNAVGEWRARRELLSDGQRAGASLLDASDAKDDITDSNEMVYSGSIHELNELRQSMRKRLSVMNRLPACCNLEALIILREAWNEIDLCERMGLWYKRAAKLSFFLMLFLSVATVTMATLFSMREMEQAERLVSVGSGEAQEVDPASLVSLPLTTAEWESILLGLTLSTSFFVSLISFFDPVTKWQKLRSASLLLISDVWKFRTRTGAFQPSSTGGTSNKSKNVQPAKELLRRVIEMRDFIAEGAGVKETTFFRGLAKRHFKHGQYETDELGTVSGKCFQLVEKFDQFARDLRGDRVYGWAMLVESPLSLSRRRDTHEDASEASAIQRTCCHLSLVLKLFPLNLVRLLAFVLYAAFELVHFFRLVLVRLLVWPVRVVKREVLSCLGRKPGPEAYHHTLQPGAFDETDWHHKPLLPDDYITLRLETSLRFYQSRLAPNACGANFMFVLLLVLSIGSAVLTQIGFSVWIPIVTALASAVTSFQEFSGKSKKLQRYSSTILSLRNVRLWWDSLEVSTRNTAHNIEKLVEMVEESIGGESKSWLATSQAAKAMAKLAAEPGAEGKTEGDGK